MVLQRRQLPFPRIDPPLRVVLVEPRIPQNTGSVARMCAATGSSLHLVEPFGFVITDAKLKRAGLDYWPSVDIHQHPSFDDFLASIGDRARVCLLTTRAARCYTDWRFQAGDYLLFGSETEGLPQTVLDRFPEAGLGIPIQLDHVRSLNLATSVGIVVYEAIRQLASG